MIFFGSKKSLSWNVVDDCPGVPVEPGLVLLLFLQVETSDVLECLIEHFLLFRMAFESFDIL